jgi:SAM-dependent methyltransferase
VNTDAGTPYRAAPRNRYGHAVRGAIKSCARICTAGGCALLHDARVDPTTKQRWPAPERNKRPILDVLRRVLPERGRALEIASGSGQHAAYFAAELPQLTWQPSDVDADNLASIRAWVADAALPNLLAPIALDVCAADWGTGRVDAVFNANMIHIAPFACCEALLKGAARHLVPRGVLVMYGPFRIGGAHTAESNAEFDASLRARDPRWGVRDYEDVVQLAAAAGLRAEERIAMPANNQTLVFRR